MSAIIIKPSDAAARAILLLPVGRPCETYGTPSDHLIINTVASESVQEDHLMDVLKFRLISMN